MGCERAYPRTAVVSPRVQVVGQAGSTNADLVAAVVADPLAWPHLSVLVTEDQRAGRGRLDREWIAPAGAAVAASVLVRVGGVPPASRGWVPLVAGAAMTRAVDAQLRGSGHTVGLKWPNDVMVDGRKICGILAEVVPGQLDAVVIGAGVNTALREADLPVERATSFAVLGLEADPDRLLADYLVALDEQLQALARADGRADQAGIHGELEALCTTVGAEVRVALPGGRMLSGHAQRLDAGGRLVVISEGIETPVSAGDVVHVR